MTFLELIGKNTTQEIHELIKVIQNTLIEIDPKKHSPKKYTGFVKKKCPIQNGISSLH